jgi:hypothetical protein
VLERLAALEHELAVVKREIAVVTAAEARRRRSQLRRGDVPALAAILPAIVGLVGSEVFFCNDLVELARDNIGLRTVLAGRSPKAIGRLLWRAQDLDVGGYVVERAGARGWRVLAVCVR